MSDPSPPAESHADQQPPRDHLGWALAATVLCFLPLGLVALYFGLRTNRAVAEGRGADAARDSRWTRRWLLATVVVGVLVWAALALSVLLLGAFSG